MEAEAVEAAGRDRRASAPPRQWVVPRAGAAAAASAPLAAAAAAAASVAGLPRGCARKAGRDTDGRDRDAARSLTPHGMAAMRAPATSQGPERMNDTAEK